ncbi:hypothetical protein BCR44DRAFT_1439705 [Catenaria anguillulae PL171]|uniref:Uncharacterized protein n=1 Tax=Catenaria anguillulae PL171 TaxID=765915 RepID=A0A1Y2HHX7_9FUNG|nr:hypothetical protein BCR44DRAFT_1439705 [Catenaria anguillulae PL171]
MPANLTSRVIADTFTSPWLFAVMYVCCFSAHFPSGWIQVVPLQLPIFRSLTLGPRELRLQYG